MSARIYCLSNPAEPGLVRIVQGQAHGLEPDAWHDAAACGPGEIIDWSLEVENARNAIAALERSMRWYRKNRGGGVHRCSSKDAWSILVRHSSAHRHGPTRPSFGFSDALVTILLALALLSGILAMQVTTFDMAMGLSGTAVVTVMLTLYLVCARDREAVK